MNYLKGEINPVDVAVLRARLVSFWKAASSVLT